MSEKDDISLFNQIKTGNISAYESLFHRHYANLTQYCYKLVRNKAIAEEIAQEVFIYLWEKRDAIEITSSITSYLYSAIRNKSINYIKYELPKQQSQVDITESTLTISGDQYVDESEQLNKKINLAIDELPEKCKEIFLLSRYAGMTYQEIAEELEISLKTVENQISIALKKLRTKLHKDIKYYLNEK